MKATLWLSAFLLFLCCPGLLAQNRQVDSLRHLLAQPSPAAQRAEIYLHMAEIFNNMNWGDSCHHYAYKAVLLGRESGRVDLAAKGTYQMANMRMNRGEYALATAAYAEAKQLFRRCQFPFDTFQTHIDLARANASLGYMPLAVAHLDSASALVGPHDHRRAMMHARVTANVLSAQNRYAEALAYRHRVLSLVSDTSPPSDQLRALFGMAFDLNHLNRHDSAIQYIRLAIPLAVQFKDYYMEWHLRGNLGMNLIKKGKYAEGLSAFESADDLLPKVGNNICCGNGSYQALALIRLGRREEALKYIRQAETFLPENAIERKNNLSTLVAVYEEMGDFEKAYSTLKRLKITEDTLVRQEHQQATADLEVRYRSREQTAALAEQQAQLCRQRFYMLAALIVAGLLGALAWQYRRVGQTRKQAALATSAQNKALKALDAAKSRFFANISHEFRTPLTLILAPLETAIGTVKEHALRDQLKAAQRSARQLLALVEEVLDLSRLEAGKLTLQTSEMAPVPWLRQRLAGFESLAAMHRIKIHLETQCPEPLLLHLDAGKLEKIINNLLGNALKFTDRGGKVHCLMVWQGHMDKLEGTLLIQVRDHGRGIPPEELPRIFERFYQGSAPSEMGGSGIGLTLSRDLASLMGGALSAESEPGKGSVFTLTLPAQKAAKHYAISDKLNEPSLASTDPAPTPLFKTDPDRSKSIVLVVEDNPDLRRYLEQTLSPHFQIRLAEDGIDALQRLERAHIDLVVSDVMMPRMDGFALLEQVRRQPAVFQQIPFVLLTARALDDDRLHGFQLGVDDYISKPFDPALLIARIQNLLAGQQKRQKWRKHEPTPTEDSTELALLKKAEQWVFKHLDNPDLAVGDLAKAMAQSPRNLDRSIKRLTGFTPVEFIREIRLQRARQLIQQQRYASVNEVRMAVGIDNPAYFSRVFAQRFGIGPKEMLRKAAI